MHQRLNKRILPFFLLRSFPFVQKNACTTNRNLVHLRVNQVNCLPSTWSPSAHYATIRFLELLNFFIVIIIIIIVVVNIIRRIIPSNCHKNGKSNLQKKSSVFAILSFMSSLMPCHAIALLFFCAFVLVLNWRSCWFGGVVIW